MWGLGTLVLGFRVGGFGILVWGLGVVDVGFSV